MSGVLPTTIRNGKLYFLFGKENKFEKSAPGFSDFGGGGEKGETQLDTAIREGGEELTGFLGTDDQLRRMLTASGTVTIGGADNNIVIKSGASSGSVTIANNAGTCSTSIGTGTTSGDIVIVGDNNQIISLGASGTGVKNINIGSNKKIYNTYNDLIQK
jgi:hypothetical protein